MELTEHILKNGKEFIISKYGADRYFIAIVDEKGNITPKFPFKNKDEAKNWIEGTK